MSWTQSTGRRGPSFRGTRGGRRSQGGVINERREWRERVTFQEPPPPPYGELLFEIERDGIEESPYDPKITSCSYVASYTWLHRSAPSIMIPGSPPVWNPPSHSRRLDSDKGEYFRDPNAARYPSHPLEPAVLATLEQRPELATDEIDIFTCSSTLGNLSRYVRGVDKSFRFVIEKAGSTIFFIRRENSSTQLIPDVRGYGHTFPEEYTSWGKGLAGAESHQRIIRYTFGGLRFLLRFEADGYIRKDEDEADSISEQPVEVNDLIGMLQAQQPVADRKRLNIERGGRPVPQEDIIDIKTRSAFDFKTRTIKKEIDMTDLTPRLWLSQIPTLVVGYHERGLFDDIRVRSMREEIVQWERDNEGQLRKLVSLLHELIDCARTSKTSLEVCRSESRPLEVRRLAGNGPQALSPETTIKWTARNDKGLQET